MWNGNINSNPSGGGNGVGGGRQTPRPNAPHSDEPSSNDVAVQSHVNYAPAYNPMSYYPPYYEYPPSVLQHQRMEMDMLTAAAHMQHQQLDYDRTRAAIVAAQLLRGRAGGLPPTEELSARIDEDLRLQPQPMMFAPPVSTVPNQIGYNIYSSLAPPVHPASLRMMMDHTSGLVPTLPAFAGINPIRPEPSITMDDTFNRNIQQDDLKEDKSVLTKQDQTSNMNNLQPRPSGSRAPDKSAAGDTNNTSHGHSHELNRSAMEQKPLGDVLARLDTLPITTEPKISDKIHSKNKGINSSLEEGAVTPKVQSTAKKTPNSSKQGKLSASPYFSTNRLLIQTGIHPSLGDSVPVLTEADYVNLEALMTQFCKVPFLAEFCRPISVLHPELVSSYSRVVRQSIDLGVVCRRIHNRVYKSGRAVCLDVWRIFSNCIKFHTHPSTRDISIPSFVSIASHLSDYFTSLWLEYMLPSDTPDFSIEYQNDSLNAVELTDENNSDQMALTHLLKRDPYTMSRKNAFDEREIRRSTRLKVLGPTTFLTPNTLIKISNFINTFVESGGSVDILDPSLITAFSEKSGADGLNHDVLSLVEPCFSLLRKLSEKLAAFAALENNPATNGANIPEYCINELHSDLFKCHLPVAAHKSLSGLIHARFHRIIGKVTAPIYEINNRGVNQSSIWGCSAAVIWARESTKRPFWPAIVIGVLAPDDQKEPWHEILTDVNELRLPEKLRSELMNGKKKAEASIQKQSLGASPERMSFFLVEFLGSHEFIWVREADIMEKFDPNEDPNQESSNGGKKRNRVQVPTNFKSFQKAVEEGQWALEELDVQMTDPCGDMSQDLFTNQDFSHSFTSLCNEPLFSVSPDDEANVIESTADLQSLTNPSDLEELNELLATNGLMDCSADGKKNAKKRAIAIKRFQSDNNRVFLKTEKEVRDGHKKTPSDNPKKSLLSSHSPKVKVPLKFKSADDKNNRKSDSLREEKELLKRRKKREREREKVLKEEDRKSKKQKTDNENIVRIGRRFGFVDKRGRARAVVRGYLHRLSKEEDVQSNLSIDGMAPISISSVEGGSLLGLAVAFRAAAGEISMPASSDFVPPTKAWDKIDADSPLTSRERCERLEKKISLLQKAVEMLGESNRRRKALIEAALSEKELLDIRIENEEKAALVNDIPKKSKTPTTVKTTESIVEESSVVQDS